MKRIKSLTIYSQTVQGNGFVGSTTIVSGIHENKMVYEIELYSEINGPVKITLDASEFIILMETINQLRLIESRMNYE